MGESNFNLLSDLDFTPSKKIQRHEDLTPHSIISVSSISPNGRTDSILGSANKAAGNVMDLVSPNNQKCKSILIVSAAF